MFHFGLGEFLLVVVVAFLVLGPKELPRVLKSLGSFSAKVQKIWAKAQEPWESTDHPKKKSDEPPNN